MEIKIKKLYEDKIKITNNTTILAYAKEDKKNFSRYRFCNF